MEFLTWCQRWLKRHPLKEFPMLDRSFYTAEVMAKVRALSPTPLREARSNPSRSWLLWPRWAFIALTAAAGIAVVIGTIRSSTRQLAQQVTYEGQLLAAVGAFDEEAMDTYLLAEAPSDDERWLDQAAQVLEQVNDESEDHSSGSEEEDLLNELELLDQAKPSASS